MYGLFDFDRHVLLYYCDKTISLGLFPHLRFRPPWQVFILDWPPFSNPLIVHSQIIREASSHVFY